MIVNRLSYFFLFVYSFILLHNITSHEHLENLNAHAHEHEHDHSHIHHHDHFHADHTWFDSVIHLLGDLGHHDSDEDHADHPDYLKTKTFDGAIGFIPFASSTPYCFLFAPELPEAASDLFVSPERKLSSGIHEIPLLRGPPTLA